MSGGGLFCTFCFDKESLNVAKLPEWEDEYKFICALFATPTDPALNAIPLCDNCLHNFRQFSHLREQLVRIQAEIRELKRIFGDRILSSEDSAEIQYAVNSIPKSPKKSKIQREQFAQFQSVRGFRQGVIKTLKTLVNQGSRGRRSGSGGKQGWKRSGGGKSGGKRARVESKDESGDDNDDRPDRWIDEEEGDLAASAINDFDNQYFDTVLDDPDWNDEPNETPSPTRHSEKASSRGRNRTSPSRPTSNNSIPKEHSTATPKKASGDELCSYVKAPGADPHFRGRARSKKLMEEDGKKNYPWKCSLCPRSFKERYNLFGHFAVHTGNPNVRCHPCKMDFRSTHALKKHNLEVHGATHPYKCSTCFVKFVNSTGLKSHKCRDPLDKTETGWHCRVCKISFTKMGRYDCHMSSAHGPKEPMLQCLFCSNKYAFRTQLLTHVYNTHHSLPSVGADGSSVFKCSLCPAPQNDVVYPSALALLTHWFLHGLHVYAKNDCRVCDVAFATADFYHEHMQNTHGLKIQPRTACDQCNVTLVTPHHLHFHLKFHKEWQDKRSINNVMIGAGVKCPHCNSTFRDHNLRKHIQIVHWPNTMEGLRLLCFEEHCAQEFEKREEWISHMLQHKKEGGGRNFHLCDICQVPFAFNSTLRRHYDNEHPREQDIQLQGLFESVANEEAAATDSFTPGGGDLFRVSSLRKKCQVCHKSFRVKNHLGRHLRLFHAKNRSLKIIPLKPSVKKKFAKIRKTRPLDIRCGIFELPPRMTMQGAGDSDVFLLIPRRKRELAEMEGPYIEDLLRRPEWSKRNSPDIQKTSVKLLKIEEHQRNPRNRNE